MKTIRYIAFNFDIEFSRNCVSNLTQHFHKSLSKSPILNCEFCSSTPNADIRVASGVLREPRALRAGCPSAACWNGKTTHEPASLTECPAMALRFANFALCNPHNHLQKRYYFPCSQIKQLQPFEFPNLLSYPRAHSSLWWALKKVFPRSASFLRTHFFYNMKVLC